MTADQIREWLNQYSHEIELKPAVLLAPLVELAAQMAEQTAIMRQILEFWAKHHDLQVEGLRLQRQQIEKLDLRYKLSELSQQLNKPQENKSDEK